MPNSEWRRSLLLSLKKNKGMLMIPSFVTALSLWALPGLMAGTGFPGIALIVGALTRTVWAVPDGIAYDY